MTMTEKVALSSNFYHIKQSATTQAKTNEHTHTNRVAYILINCLTQYLFVQESTDVEATDSLLPLLNTIFNGIFTFTVVLTSVG